jgi:cyclomaltodextrinase
MTKRRGLAGLVGMGLWLAASTRGEAPAGLRAGPPSWAADAVWYQVFPERFRNGDPRNDPRPADLRGAWPHDPIRDWRLSPWTADWYKLQPWEKTNGRDFYYNAQLRRYGGDLQGVIDKLDYLQSLGVTAISLNPIFEAPSLHKYDTTFYHHVDNNFGPDPDGDRLIWATENPLEPSTWKWTAADRLFLRLVQECHRRQMKVILDGVFNHVGLTFWAFRDVRTKQAQSKYTGWFVIDRFDDPRTPADEFDYRGWAGARELPELRKEGDTLAAGPRDHLRAIVKRWGDPNGDGDPSDGVDGWRLEVAQKVPHGFWREFRKWVLTINPEAYLTGEVWWEDFSANKMWNPAPWLKGDEFDAVLNYRFADAVKAFFIDRQSPIGATEFDERLAALRADCPPPTNLALMNLLDSHDTDRLASQIVNPDRPYGHARGPRDDPRYDVRAPRAEEWRRLRLVAAFQFAYLGAPMVYYGTEAGMWGGEDPDDRKPMVWRELRYEDEATHPLGQARRADPVRFDEELFKYYQSLGHIRATQAPLRRGTFETVLADDARRVYAFVRALEDDRVLAVFNASDREQALELPFPLPARDLLSGRRYKPRGGKTALSLPALGAALLASEAGAAPVSASPR